MCVTMLALARWQLLRADEKIEILTAAERADAQAPVDFSTLQTDTAIQSAAEGYRRVTSSGRWLAEQQFLWDNRAHASQAGVEVITPLQLDSGRVLLVNRGWTRLGVTRDVLPDVTLEDAADLRVAGNLSSPSRGFAKGDAFESAAPWPRYLQYFDYDTISAALDAEVLPVVLQADHGSAGPWLQSNWQPAASGPEKHYAYAVQWFGMAAALTVIFIAVNRRRHTATHEPDVVPLPRDCARFRNRS